jgi:predicted small secreted protein
MKTYLRLPFVALLACMAFAAGNATAGTAEDLQIVFSSYHKALLAGDSDGMLKWTVKSRRDAFAKFSAAQRNDAMAFAVASTPKTYKATTWIIEPNRRDATLYLIADVTDKGKTEPLYGSVVYEKEGDSWKVQQAGAAFSIRLPRQPRRWRNPPLQG